MFGKTKAQETNEAQKTSDPFTYIHHGTVLEGDLDAKGRVRIHGTVRGKVTVAGVLEIAEGGLVEGDSIQADTVRIIGAVKANIEAKGKIEIWKTGILEGDVKASALDIEEGARFTGRSEMRPLNAVNPSPSVSAKGTTKTPSLTQGRVAEGLKAGA